MERKLTNPASKAKPAAPAVQKTAPAAPQASRTVAAKPAIVSAPAPVAAQPVAAPKPVAAAAAAAAKPVEVKASPAPVATKPAVAVAVAKPEAARAKAAPKAAEATKGLQALNARAVALWLDQGKGQIQLANALVTSKTPVEAFKLAQDFSQTQFKAWQSFGEAWLETLRQSGASIFKA
ncbi:MAG: hypothetical protein KGQ37_10195 [Hyphomicrobiales bacterium]|nr:hypothetical protein [Hyphomicrobiales bacterium]